jgi:hypothetical protein
VHSAKAVPRPRSTGLRPFLRTGPSSYLDGVSSFRITLKDRSTEEIAGVDAYQQEGQMTTFFRMASGRRVVDAWSERVASFRTSEIVAIRRVEHTDAGHSTVAVPAPETDPGGALATMSLRSA